MMMSLFVSCPRGFEYLLEEEVKALGLQVTKVSPQGVFGEGTLAVAYQLCLWSRIANRVQWILFTGEVPNEKALYQLCLNYSWHTLFSSQKSLAIEFHGQSFFIRNTMYGAMLVKDAIVDYFRALSGSRPNIDKDNPDVKLHAFLNKGQLTVSVDLTGYSLHQRGYRLKAGAAPIKENVAAALLIRAHWPALVEQGYGLYDPFCGAGTFVIEAALMAAMIAPGLLREDQALIHLESFESALWQKLREEARAKMRSIPEVFYGCDDDAQSIVYAKENAIRAQVGQFVRFERRSMNMARPQSSRGLLICNPPYGERLSDPAVLLPVYQQLGDVMHSYFQGWEAAVLTSNVMLAKAIGLRSNKQYRVFNGQIECKLYLFSLDEKNQLKAFQAEKLTDGAQMFYNRLKKNSQHLQKWAMKEGIVAYRVYDADLPEYAFAIDRYHQAVVVSEYAPPATIPVHKAEQRALEVLQIIPQVLGVLPEDVVMKTRAKQRGNEQYQKLATQRREYVIQEGQAKFNVNLTDYLDTGLFLDHRLMRLRFAQLKPGTRFLNCFCYTASASVHAALAGAQTTNVDLSKTYLKWAEDNFKLNHLSLRSHDFIHADCVEWLKHAKGPYDVIFLDPPSFSNSKRMEGVLDIQRDHETLIQDAMHLLAKEGCLYFSTNFRQFKLSPNISSLYQVKDITKATIDVDFKRDAKIHYCFEITKKA